MLWIAFTVLAAFIWGSSELFGKFVMDREVKSPAFATLVNGASVSAIFIFSSVLMGSPTFSLSSAILPGAAGAMYMLAMWFYFNGMKREEISRFSPTISLTTVFLVIMAFFVLGEQFTFPVYLGISMAILGAFLISLDDPLKSFRKMKSRAAFILALLAAFGFASRDILLKLAFGSMTLWSGLFWMGTGIVLVSGLLAISQRQKLRYYREPGSRHLLMIGILSALGYLSFATAFFLGPVSLASGVLKVKAFIVFFGSVIITKITPKALHEEIDRYTLLQKLIATSMIVAGVVIIQVFG